MGSLGHRAIVQYIESNDLPGLKTFLDTRQGHVHVDDRDEVRDKMHESFMKIQLLKLNVSLEWSHSTYGCKFQRCHIICTRASCSWC